MNFRLSVSAALLVATGLTSAVADTFPRQPGVDVLHYRFDLVLSDETDVITGEATIDLRLLDSAVSDFVLDLIGEPSDDPTTGMMVTQARWVGSENSSAFSHEAGKLHVPLASPAQVGDRRQLEVTYSGTPATGLIIGENKHGRRCFFSDNWPNKARHWLPMVDHPYDKATADMVITAPSHYQAISNGLLVEETDLGDGRRRTHWRQSVPIASWLYALGVAPFAVDHRTPFRGLPVQTWVFAEDRDAGFDDFAEPTHHVLEFFSDYIGPFPYEKLANVQSNSVSGGMESATAIFYDDDSVTGERSSRWQSVVVHEIAHQWWGNSVTEADWDDVWLSEGFATYFTLLFTEHAQGRDAMVARLESNLNSIFEFQERHPDYRLVHDNLDDMRAVLTRHIYIKGAWVLHMLRGVLGDSVFQSGIREYYRLYRDANASTRDLRQVMEEAGNVDLEWFFEQWLYRGGSLVVDGTWSWSEGVLELELRQTQDSEVFRMPLGIEITGESGDASVETVQLDQRSEVFRLQVEEPPIGVRLNPRHEVLMKSTLEPR